MGKNLGRAVVAGLLSALICAGLLFAINRFFGFEPLAVTWWRVVPIGAAFTAAVFGVVYQSLLVRLNARPAWLVSLIGAAAGAGVFILYFLTRYLLAAATLPENTPRADLATFIDLIGGPFAWLGALLLVLGGYFGASTLKDRPLCASCDRYSRWEGRRESYFLHEQEYDRFRDDLTRPGSIAAAVAADRPKLDDEEGRHYVDTTLYRCRTCGSQQLEHRHQQYRNNAWQSPKDGRWVQEVPGGVDLAPIFNQDQADEHRPSTA